MCSLTHILLFVIVIIFSSAKQFLPDLKHEEFEMDYLSSELTKLESEDSRLRVNFWVLDISDEVLDNLTLRSPTAQDEKDFIAYCEPIIKKYETLKLDIVKNNAKPANKPEISKTKLITKKDILKYLNKILMFSRTGANPYFSDSHQEDKPSITIHFKEPYSALIVKTGLNLQNYFYAVFVDLPFPSWFYEEHTNRIQDNIPLPENVKEKFYITLYSLLQQAMVLVL